MEQVREDRLGEPGYVWVASTLGGNPISTAAARAALGVFREPDCYQRLRDLGRYLRNGMRQVLEEHQEQAQVIGDGPLAQVVFSAKPVNDYRSTRRGDGTKGRALMLALFRRKIFSQSDGYPALPVGGSFAGRLRWLSRPLCRCPAGRESGSGIVSARAADGQVCKSYYDDAAHKNGWRRDGNDKTPSIRVAFKTPVLLPTVTVYETKKTGFVRKLTLWGPEGEATEYEVKDPRIGCSGAAKFRLCQHPAPVLAVTVATAGSNVEAAAVLLPACP